MSYLLPPEGNWSVFIQIAKNAISLEVRGIFSNWCITREGMNSSMYSTNMHYYNVINLYTFYSPNSKIRRQTNTFKLLISNYIFCVFYIILYYSIKLYEKCLENSKIYKWNCTWFEGIFTKRIQWDKRHKIQLFWLAKANPRMLFRSKISRNPKLN